jgi:hypothetical protein
MSELKFKLIRRRRGDPVTEEQVVEYCTREDGQHTLTTIAEATHGDRKINSVHYVGRDGDIWIAEIKRVYD